MKIKWLISAAAGALLSSTAIAGPTYTYDDLGRVTSAIYDSGQQITYSYDPAGNRTSVATTAAIANRPPVANPLSATIYEDQTSITLDPLAIGSDPDVGDTRTIYSVSNGLYGTAVITNGGTRILYTPATKRTQTDKLVYVVTDSHNVSSSGQITITLANKAPIAVNDGVNVIFNTPLTFDPRLNDTDPGGDPFTITSVSGGSHGTVAITPGGASVTYTPTAGWTATDQFTYVITDIDGATSAATVATSIDHLPVTVYDRFNTPINVALVNIDPSTNDTDPDGDALSIIASANGAHGTVALNSAHSLTYTPVVGFSGTDTFSYTISDGRTGTATGTVIMNVQSAVNHAPIAVADSQYILAHGQVTFDPRANDSDPDGDPLSITAASVGGPGVGKGTVTIGPNGTSLTYQHNAGGGTDTISYTITDGRTGFSTATVTMNIDSTGCPLC